MPVAELHVGMHVRKADSTYGEITGWYVVPGASVMYNLTVAQDHTYTVGDEHWVVHNLNEECFPSRNAAFRQAKRDAGIPIGEQPTRVVNDETTRMTDSSSRNILDDNGLPIRTREYHFDDQGIVIQDHGAGHQFPDGGSEGPHFNVRPAGDTRHGVVPGTLAHYPWEP